MLLALGIVLGGVALVATLRWVVVRVDSLGRPHPFPVVTVAVPVVGAMVCALPVVHHAQLESRLSRVAGVLAGATVSVSCETVGQGWLDAHPERGYVELGSDGVPARHAVITYDTCNDLAAWIDSDHEAPDEQQVVAVHVLTHEAMHMAGTVDEASAECAALQRDTRTAELLGATPLQARALARRYYLAVFPRLPEAYRSTQCGASGSLDEHLEDSPWT